MFRWIEARDGSVELSVPSYVVAKVEELLRTAQKTIVTRNATKKVNINNEELIRKRLTVHDCGRREKDMQ